MKEFLKPASESQEAQRSPEELVQAATEILEEERSRLGGKLTTLKVFQGLDWAAILGATAIYTNEFLRMRNLPHIDSETSQDIASSRYFAPGIGLLGALNGLMMIAGAKVANKLNDVRKKLYGVDTDTEE